MVREKQLHTKVHQILPKATADLLRPKGSRLVHLYGLPKTHTAKLSMRPILSASATSNYTLAKWLEGKLKPLPTNEYCFNDIFTFAEEVSDTSIKFDHIFTVSRMMFFFAYERSFEGNHIHSCRQSLQGRLVNKAHNLQLQKHQLTELL